MASKRRTFEKDYIGDTPDRIKLCLSCPYKECTNCLEAIPQGADLAMIRRVPCADGLKLSKTDILVLDNYVHSKSDADIALKIGVNAASVQHSRTKLSLPVLKHTPMVDRRRFVQQWKDKIRMRDEA